MLLSERLISSLESVLPKPDRCFYGEWAETRKGHVYSSEAQGICFEGQQSARNYSEPQLMGLKSPLKLYSLNTRSVRCCNVQVKFSSNEGK